MNQLEQIKQFSKVVADTGDISVLKKYDTLDATTNPKLILDACQQEQYQKIFVQALEESKLDDGSSFSRPIRFAAHFITAIGCQILNIIPGRISSELDPRLSFDTEGTIHRAKYLIGSYEKKGISRERILIKIASTWEGIKAAQELEKEGIRCNLTLLFSLVQAIACAEAKVTLISPFIGRLNEYYQTNKIDSDTDSPGKKLIKSIVNYYSLNDVKTEIMAASFRNKEQVLSIAGVELMTIPPELLDQLMASDELVSQQITPIGTQTPTHIKLNNRENFMRSLSQDKPAFNLLKDGILKFTKASLKLRQIAFDQSKFTLLTSVLTEMVRQSIRMK